MDPRGMEHIVDTVELMAAASRKASSASDPGVRGSSGKDSIGGPQRPNVLEDERRPLARLHRPAPSTTQSAPAHRQPWVLEFEPNYPLRIEPLMGWTSSEDVLQQVKLTFPTRQAGLRFADKHGLRCIIFEPHQRCCRPKSYSAQFRR